MELEGRHEGSHEELIAMSAFLTNQLSAREDFFGEASLRMAKEINPKSSPYSRPESDLKVSYLIFPGTRDPADAPDLEKWHGKVGALLKDIGGLGEGYELHRWADYFAAEAAGE